MVDIFYPFQFISDKITYNLLNLVSGTHLADSANFIIYDVLKIFFLLIFMIFIVSYIRSYITVEKTRKLLGGRKGIFFNFIASCVGVVTPFCSCSSVPLFIGFVEAGIPLGVTFSFLITSPLVNEAALAVLWAIFGLRLTLIYLISGIAIGVIGGYVIGLFKMEKHVADFVYDVKLKKLKEQETTQNERVGYAINEVKSIFKKVWIYVIAGVTLGGIFHGFAPEGILAKYAGSSLLGVPIATIIGIPLYSNVMGMIPIIESLVAKGLPIGTALAFLMAVTALSLPEIIILKKVLKKKLIITFVVVTGLAIMFTGYLFNWLI
ncbi:MAG: permease [Nanoarchaeota archaeon]|nr:permease [Nanoarchaeota archaeon]